MDGGGSCFGFEIHSSLSFKYLRGGKGEGLRITWPSEEVEGGHRQLLYEWLPRPGHPLHARLYQVGDLYCFWVAGMGTFVVDAEHHRIAVPEATDVVQREERLWGIPTGLCFLRRGDIPIHAAAAEVEGSAVLLAAPGRFGKSTLAAAFHTAGHRVLSEDLSCLQFSPTISVIPGPAMLRIRQDVMHRLTLRNAQVVRQDAERCSLALDEGRRGSCCPVPLRAAVLLRESTSGVLLERVPATTAIPDLWNLSFRLPTAESQARCFQAVADLAKGIPTWNVLRPLRLEDLPETVDKIVRNCLQYA